MSTRSKTRGPKRAITRMREGFLHTVGTAVTTVAIFTAVRRLTLIRALIQGTMVHTQLTTDFNEYELLLEKVPRGATVAAVPSLGNVAMNEVPNEEILRHRGAAGDSTAAGTASKEHIFIDTKAMRKLRIDDNIRLTVITDLSAAFSFNGNLYLWFKEV